MNIFSIGFIFLGGFGVGFFLACLLVFLEEEKREKGNE